MGMFEDLKEPTVFGDIAQQENDEDVTNAATGIVKLAGKLVKDGLGATLETYGKAHSAVKAGLANIVNSATGDDEFSPIEAVQAGWESGNVTAEDVVSGPMQALENVMPTITTPQNWNKLIHSTIPVGGLLPEVPEEVQPSQYLKGISQGAQVVVDTITDPLLATISPALRGAKAVSKVIGLTNAVKSTLKKSLEVLPKGLVDNITWAFTEKGGRLPELVSMLDKLHMDENKGRQIAKTMRDALSVGLSREQQLIIGNRIKRNIKTRLADPELEAKAEMARKALDYFGKAYSKEGFISTEKFFENVGRYSPRMYAKHELKMLELKTGFKAAPIKIGGQRAMARKEIDAATRKKMGEILEPAYPVSRAIQQIQHDLNVHNLFKSVMGKAEWVSDVVKPGYKMFDGKRFGILNGKWVRNDIALDLEPVVHIPSKFAKFYLGLMSKYKMLKILPNPATHFRNIFGNVFMADMSPLGGGLFSVPKRISEAVSEVAKRGKYMDELLENGAWASDFVSEERAFLEGISREFGKAGSGLDLITKPHDGYFKNLYSKGKQFADKGMDMLSKVYTGEDNAFKMMHYIDARKSGMDVPKAIEYMRKWGLDYSRVSPAVQFARNYTTPFIAYQAKVLPRLAEVIGTNPAKFYKWPVIFDAIDRMSARAHNVNEADLEFVHKSGNGRNMLTPWVDKDDNPLSMDLTYILPWGDLQEQGQMFGLPPSLSISNPLFTIPAQLWLNKNSYLNSPIMPDTDEDGRALPFSTWDNAKAFTSFIYKSLMPSIAPGGYSWDKVNKHLDTVPEHKLTKTGEPLEFNRTLLDVVYGIKLRGINIDKQKMFDSLGMQKWMRNEKSKVKKFMMDRSKTDSEKEAYVEKQKERMTQHIMEWAKKRGEP